MSRPLRLICCGFVALIVSASTFPVGAANWTINRVNHVVLAPPGGVNDDQMSGVTYLGVVDGKHRFAAAQETLHQLLSFDLTFDAAGAIAAVSDVAPITFTPLEIGEDFEGIAFTDPTRDSVFLSDEDILTTKDRVGVREVNLITGEELQAVTIPKIFENRRPNLGFESLTRSPDGAVMWTANEQSLSVDGPIATSSAGTDVRLLRLNASGNGYAAGPQFAYQVEPIHGLELFNDAQSGLSDLVAMPDGTLITLERSLGFVFSEGLLTFLNRMYEVDFTGATDVGVGPTALGLAGQSFTRVGKELLWSGKADGAAGQNLEGLTLGPRLTNGDWVLLGVVDAEAGDPLSQSTIVAFTASPVTSADFNGDGVVDGADFLQWQRGSGKTIGATHQEGDANRDGAVDATDLELWKASFSAPPADGTVAAIPEPATALMSAIAGLVIAARLRPKNLWEGSPTPKRRG
jgi:hypothetical protein